MPFTIHHIKASEVNEPVVVFPLKQYDKLMEYLEDIEDRLAIKERENDETIPWSEVKKDIER